MTFAIVNITSEYSPTFGMYGPFESEDTAADYLRSRGWSENINGTQGLWYVRNGQHEGINARIEPLRDISDLPRAYTGRATRQRSTTG